MKKQFAKYLKATCVPAAALLVAVIVFSGCSGNKPQNTDPWIKDYAADLSDRGLYGQAAEAYEQYLLTPGLDPKIRANVHYLVGDIYRERLFDYERAIANYVKVKYLDPETKLQGKIDKKIIECLEKLGRSVDAKRELDRVISNAPRETGEEKIVARLGDRNVTGGELDRIIAKRFPNPDELTAREKEDVLRSYMANELMANAAERKGYADDPETLERIEDFRRMVLSQKIFQEEVGSTVKVDPEKVSLYYKANKDNFLDDDGNPKPFEEVNREIYSKLYVEEQQAAAQKYISRLLQAERVEIFRENIKGAPERAKPRGTVAQ